MFLAYISGKEGIVYIVHALLCDVVVGVVPPPPPPQHIPPVHKNLISMLVISEREYLFKIVLHSLQLL